MNPPAMAAWNLGLRFLLELGALSGLGTTAWRLSDGAWRWVGAVALPVAAAVLWVTFNIPDDPSRSGEAPIEVSGATRLGIELAVLCAGSAGLLWRGPRWAGLVMLAGVVAAYIGAGFGPVEMNILTELWLGYPLGAYSGSRAWPEATTEAALAGLRDRDLLDGDDLTSLGRTVRGTIEDSTDAMEQPVVDALGGELDTIVGQLAIWSRRCVDAAMFPPDPRKRAAG